MLLSVNFRVRPLRFWAWEGSNYPSRSCDGPNGPKGPKFDKTQIYSAYFGFAFIRWFAHQFWLWEGSNYPSRSSNGPIGSKGSKFKKQQQKEKLSRSHTTSGSASMKRHDAFMNI